MDNKGRRISEMATRMDGFGMLSADDFPALSVGGQRFSTLRDLNTKLDLYGSRWAQEKNAARAATQAKSTWLLSVRRQMKRYRETALSCEGQQPGISQNFKMPASNSAESIIETARAFVAAATPLKPLFLGREMPETFLEDLTDTIQMYEDTVNSYNLHSANASAAKTMFESMCSQALTLRRELNAMVRNKYRDDPEKLSLWETASHLERQAQRGASAEPGDGNEPPENGNEPPAGGQG
ncbi:MAG TPA: hypothetical protein VF591_06275 [Pyrinomonadaceae bacterium]|jgi:hypothetical protein